ncbi:LutB/LldF family L-lactate oxidation iron-sulfur protein [Helicobacter mustelae]|uniref:Putative iron-sulfur protein n=1 Tax=Helicobacter mustelae (strain ATCC 43772 / CCUG 25715 / CIP 103759 / LMG 18044 / NCTC 12198 / R85-136P) TaxID=679897 RepID=D3UHT8_HELM1|nr:LutB/LldF family L-lactate oxidation iron-sulfur protein [Helicobacter mustelae]CBG40061.1 putative iron-sulfur protein [Helicobacter mustelae 12198]SQH71575.1 iron-sulfur protein [Helicobacter mustelae]STP12700.1 iron-sulfur protein [Helicobacter mustelae]
MKTFYHSSEDYQEIIQHKLIDKQLRTNLKSAMDTLKNNRRNLINSRYTKWKDLREQGRQVKIKALTHLDELLERFEKNATRNGIQVHWASTGEDANKIIFDLIKKNNATSILKGKSMISEEIHLNTYLKQRGIQAVETDLGELIIQLIDETPVHIVVPAVHKNRYEIGEIFKEKLGAPLETQPEKLNAIARKHLRKEFETFKIGLTGVNFAIANEGAIWLVENEGNGRMTTTACDIHVAICGIEKVIESFEDASVLGTLLAPSAIGAPITCYNNIITSPRKEGEKDGPKEVHVILVDNHRSNMLNDKNFFKSLSCIRCGTCLNHCPVYDKIGGHAYLSTYPGPIGEVISPQLFGINNCAPIVNLCSLCGRCSEVCPVKIPLAELIRDLRSEKVGQGYGKVLGYQKNSPGHAMEQKMMNGFASFATSGSKWRNMLWVVRNFGGLGKLLHPMIPVLNKWTKYRVFPPIDASLHQQIQKLKGVIYE